MSDIFNCFDPKALKVRPTIRPRLMEESANGESGASIYPYSVMCNAAYAVLSDGAVGKAKLQFPPFKIEKKAKKTIFHNFEVICGIMHRSPDQVMQFICAEQNTTANPGGNGSLIINARLNPSQIETLIFQYAKTYVQCPVCHAVDTVLEKKDRLLYIVCKNCTVRRTVQQVRQGFVASLQKRKK